MTNCLHLCSDSDASASTSARSSRSSVLGSGLSTRSVTTTESDAEAEALDSVRVVARLVILFRMFTFHYLICCFRDHFLIYLIDCLVCQKLC